MSHREVDLLTGRAFRMLKSARNALVTGDYDIAAFMADQAVQLYLKSVVFKSTGEIPRVHAIRQLLGILGTALSRSEEVEQFVRKNRSLLIRLEEAYITSRYVPREYEREEVEELVNFAEEAVKFAEHLEGKA